MEIEITSEVRRLAELLAENQTAHLNGANEETAYVYDGEFDQEHSPEAFTALARLGAGVLMKAKSIVDD